MTMQEERQQPIVPRQQSRFAFAQDKLMEPVSTSASPKSTAAPKPTATALPARQCGIVARIVGKQPAPKYGFIRAENGGDVFFCWKTLPIDLMACLEKGSAVQFDVKPNPHSGEKPMAVNIVTMDNENKYKDREGVLDRWLPEKGYGFVRAFDREEGRGQTYFAHKNSFAADLRKQLRPGLRVVFDKSLNYKASPPKPFALNVRVLPDASAPVLRQVLQERSPENDWRLKRDHNVRQWQPGGCVSWRTRAI